MDKEEDSAFCQDNHQAEDLSAKMARKSKPIPPPLNLTAMGESETSTSPLKDFAMIATSPRSPLVQKNLPFRKRAHSYSSTQTSSECDSPESPRVPASPIAREPSAAPSPSPCQIKSPLSSPTSHFFNKRFLQEPIKSLLPSPNTSASFFNNECDPIKSPMTGHPFFRPNSDLLSLPMMEKNSIKSPLQTPTRSVFLQNHVDSALFDIDKFPLKSPLNTPTRQGFHAPNDFFAMPEPIGVVKNEPNDHQESEKVRQEESKGDYMKIHKDLSTKFRNEKENIADIGFQSDSIKQEPMDLIDFSTDKNNKTEIYDLRSPVVNQVDLSNSIKAEKAEVPVHHPEQVPSLLPLDCHKGNSNNYKSDLDFSVKKEPSSPLRSDDRSQNSCSNELLMSLPYNHFIDNKFLENYKINKNFLIPQNVGYYCSDLTDPYLNASSPESFSNSQMQNHSDLNRLTSHELIENNSSVNNRLNVMKSSGTYNKPQTYNKSKNSGVLKRNVATDKSDEEGGKKSKKELDGERPRRPMNAFMLYAKYKRPILIQENPGKDNRAISVLLGVCWREIEPNVRADYVRRAAALATEHKRRHPDCWKRRRARTNNNQTPGRSVPGNPVTDVSTTS